MEELALLEAELLLIQNNISRVQKFVLDNKTENVHYSPSSSLVFGELKHRLVSLKQRCVIINKMSTSNLFKK